MGQPSDAIPIPSAARTATFNGDEQRNVGGKGVALTLDITAASGTSPTLDVKVQIKHPARDVWIDLPTAVFAQKVATGQDSLIIYPGITVTANRQVSSIVPSVWRLVCTIGGTTPSFTFSVGASYIP